jgi:hypothetical protein
VHRCCDAFPPLCGEELTSDQGQEWGKPATERIKCPTRLTESLHRRNPRGVPPAVRLTDGLSNPHRSGESKHRRQRTSERRQFA